MLLLLWLLLLHLHPHGAPRRSRTGRRLKRRGLFRTGVRILMHHRLRTVLKGGLGPASGRRGSGAADDRRGVVIVVSSGEEGVQSLLLGFTTTITVSSSSAKRAIPVEVTIETAEGVCKASVFSADVPPRSAPRIGMVQKDGGDDAADVGGIVQTTMGIVCSNVVVLLSDVRLRQLTLQIGRFAYGRSRSSMRGLRN